MMKVELIFTFFTVMYGLLLTDLFLRFHRLLRAGKSVKWHWLAPLAAWYIFIIILKNWWDLESINPGLDNMNILIFLVYGHFFLILFLLVASVFPDLDKNKTVDLKAYYFDNRRYFWGLLTTVLLLTIVIRLIKNAANLGAVNLIMLLPIVLYIAAMIVLAITKRVRVHAVLLILFVLETLVEIVSRI